jgi:hypothetical protein
MSTATTELDHERLRAALGDLPQLLHIADQARGFFGPIDCVEGGCDHVDGPQQCPLLQVRYATVQDLELLDDATTALRRIAELARHGLTADPATGLDLFHQISDLASPGHNTLRQVRP